MSLTALAVGLRVIDLWAVATNGLWILGLSILLAAFSYHEWLASEAGGRRRDLFKQRSSFLLWTLGMLLTCFGWGLSQADHWWERALWFGLAASFGWQMFRLPLTAWTPPREPQNPDCE